MKIFEIQVSLKSNKFRIKVDKEREKYLKRKGITRDTDIVRNFVDENYDNIIRSFDNNDLEINAQVKHLVKIDI